MEDVRKAGKCKFIGLSEVRTSIFLWAKVDPD